MPSSIIEKVINSIKTRSCKSARCAQWVVLACGVLISHVFFFVETELIYLLKSEPRMGLYLEECDRESQKIDSRIWQIHASIPRKKQMSVLNSFIEKIIAKQATIVNFLPKSMVRAKVYRSLQIPFSVNPVSDVVKVDVKNTE